MKQKPSSDLHLIAEHFYHDAVDFERRFSLLWESGQLMHKTGRIKSFIDLVMGCECSLKSHALLSMNGSSLSDAYEKVRSCGHRIDRLASLAAFLSDRTHYECLAINLRDFPVSMRYSLDAHEMFFPASIDGDTNDELYSETIGLDTWIGGVHNNLVHLNTSLAYEFSGDVSMDFCEHLQQQRALRMFSDKHIKNPRTSAKSIVSLPIKNGSEE